MAKLTYAQQLAHPQWQRRRLEMLNAADWKCSCCSNEEKQLHVHHRAYFKGRMAWEYADHELAVLCGDCHTAEHEAKELLDQLLLAVPLGQAPIQEALSLLLGFFECEDSSEEFFWKAAELQEASEDYSGRDLGSAGFIASMVADLKTETKAELFTYLNALRVREGLDER